jgi:hypothetical protein
VQVVRSFSHLSVVGLPEPPIASTGYTLTDCGLSAPPLASFVGVTLTSSLSSTVGLDGGLGIVIFTSLYVSSRNT